MTLNSRRDEEENIFRRKLLYDGHGTGEDRRLVTILKNITKLCLAENSNDDTIKLVNLISKDLTTAINSAERHEKTSQMCDKSLESLEESIEQQSKLIEDLRSELSNLELELEFSERLKRVNAQPDCQKTYMAMRAIDKRKTSLMAKIDRQTSNIQTLVEACINLQKVISDLEEPNNSSTSITSR